MSESNTGNFAVVSSGAITNIIVCIMSSPPTMPDGETLVHVDGITPAPQIGWVATQNGSAWAFTAPPEPAPPPPTLQQQAAAQLLAGAQIVSASTPGLNGTYDCGQSSQVQINAVWNYVIKFGTFFGGATSYAWADQAGAPHNFPSVEVFEDFAAKMGTYIAALTQIALGLTTGPRPSSTVNIL